MNDRLLDASTIPEHVHAAPFDGSGNDDECACGAILCPDTGTVVDYVPAYGDYWHADGSVCFLHRRSLHDAGTELLAAVAAERGTTVADLIATLEEARQ